MHKIPCILCNLLPSDFFRKQMLLLVKDPSLAALQRKSPATEKGGLWLIPLPAPVDSCPSGLSDATAQREEEKELALGFSTGSDGASGVGCNLLLW